MRVLPAHNPSQIEAAATEAAVHWRAGGLVAFPTETVYGLGAAARSAEAVAKVYRMKGRPADHPLIVHLPVGADLAPWVDRVPDTATRLARAFWPGPLTLVLRRSPALDGGDGGLPTVALRVPAHPVAQALLQAFGEGVAAPSANRFGRISPTTAGHVVDDLSSAPGADDLLLLDGGACQVGIESTIVDLSSGTPLVRRLGGVDLAALTEVLGGVQPAVDLGKRQGAAAPGTLDSHYAPRTPTRLVGLGEADGAPDEVAVLARRPAPGGRRGPWLRLPDAPGEAAHRLYAALRELDAAAAPAIWVEALPEDPAWAALADRLRRASTPAAQAEEVP